MEEQIEYIIAQHQDSGAVNLFAVPKDCYLSAGDIICTEGKNGIVRLSVCLCDMFRCEDHSVVEKVLSVFHQTQIGPEKVAAIATIRRVE